MVFLKVLRSTKEREKELRLLILGLDNAGKTTCVKKLNGEPTDTISPTVGFAIKSFTYGGFQLNVWDVGGQKTIRSFWKNYFEGTDGVIWVVDSADVQRLEDCRKELKNLLKEERLSGAGLLILANKQDLGGALDADSIATHLELQTIHTHRWLIQPCSARTGQGLEAGVSWLVAEAGSRVTG